ncbi:hypothetical protein MML48_10g00015058 [Holotrichia oblita]|uniref:Uncharacterized protein n=1 Tax=Holotrichia oblita TaxID=644536 RepID=A0ACB9SGN1_HOLOL|nr:hypothetical protein MML48_10g00015058 [Holotrichia oblita]
MDRIKKAEAIILYSELTNILCSDSEESDEDIALDSVLCIPKFHNYDKQETSRMKNYIEHVIPKYSEHDFQSHFRLTRPTYEFLLRLVVPLLAKECNLGRPHINYEKQLLATLWLLATPDSYRSIGERFDMAKSSLNVSVVRVTHVLNKIAPQFINWPGEIERNIHSEKVYRSYKIQGVIGFVDGTFIPIKAPNTNPHSYLTRKCNHAITLQAMCNTNLQFIDTFVGYPGSVSDARVFRNSHIFQKVSEHGEQYFSARQFILGDKAYPLLSWCITPYIDRGNLQPKHIHFNKQHSKMRSSIERAFALLFGRFRRLKYIDMNRVDLIPDTVLAACVLHNLCLKDKDGEIENYIVEGRQFIGTMDEDILQNDIVNVDLNSSNGKTFRNELCENLFQSRT